MRVELVRLMMSQIDALSLIAREMRETISCYARILHCTTIWCVTDGRGKNFESTLLESNPRSAENSNHNPEVIPRKKASDIYIYTRVK